MKLQVGVLGGAFNPPHNAHLRLAEYAIRNLKLDRLIFIPSKNTPHKIIDGIWDDFTRYLFIRAATYSIHPDEIKLFLNKRFSNDIDKFISKYSTEYQKNHSDKIEVSDIEIRQNIITYTIDTIEILKKNNPDWIIYIIIGMDQAAIVDCMEGLGKAN